MGAPPTAGCRQDGFVVACIAHSRSMPEDPCRRCALRGQARLAGGGVTHVSDGPTRGRHGLSHTAIVVTRWSRGNERGRDLAPSKVVILESIGAAVVGLGIGAFVGFLDEDGEMQTWILGFLGAVVGLSGIVTIWQQSNSSCRTSTGAGIGEAAPACEVSAWAGLLVLVVGAAACGVGYIAGRAWSSAR